MKNNYLKIILCQWFFLVFLAFPVLTQQQEFTGVVHDDSGNPVANALITIKEQPELKVFTNNDGNFRVTAQPGQILEVTTRDNRQKTIELDAANIEITMGSDDQLIPVGHRTERTRGEITSSLAIVTSDELSRSSVFDPGNALFGSLPGLTVLQGAGSGFLNSPQLYIRGVETFSVGGVDNSQILVLVDGFERPISSLSLSEIESVTVLKDAGQLAMYGMRGANGVLLVTTKRGSGRDLSVDVSYERGITQAFRLPQMMDAHEYARAYNQARINDRMDPLYSQAELALFQSGTSPYLFPNTNWLGEGLRDFGSTDHFNVQFQQQADRIKYYGVVNIYDEQGLLDFTNTNEGYSTQIYNSKVNLRVNSQIELTNTTLLNASIAGNIGEYNRPTVSGGEQGLFRHLYSTPAAVYPVRTANGEWGGRQAFPNNPIALISDAGYSKIGRQELMVDLILAQDIDQLVEGLSAEAGVSFDFSNDHLDQFSKQFRYQEDIPVLIGSDIADVNSIIYGTNTSLSFWTDVPALWRRATGFGKLNHETEWDDSKLNSSLIFQMEQLTFLGRNNTYRRMLTAGSFNYSKANKYFADLSWSFAGTNMLPSDDRFGFFPALSLGWKLSNEDFLAGNTMIDNLKLRASTGLTGNDLVIQNIAQTPMVWTTGYRYGGNNAAIGGLAEGRLGTSPLSYETSFKSNIGVDIGLFEMLDISLDAFYNRRSNILVETQGSISGVLGIDLPYSSSGIVDNKGMELGLNLYNNSGDFNYSIGGFVSYARSEIIEMNEAFRPYDYMQRTGHRIGQAFGMESNGFFSNEADIANSPDQRFSVVRPGDIKYIDQNNDGVIDEFDEVAIGYSTLVPDIYFSGIVNLRYRSIGFSAIVQGISNMTVYLNTPSIYWPLRGDNNISAFSANAWTPETASTATTPALTTQENANNYRPNSLWYQDASYLKLRSIELNYSLPVQLISRMRLQNTTLYVRGMNLWSLDNIDQTDPEVTQLAYPSTTSFNLGIKIGF